jgi:hypothetical protein
MVTIPSHQRFYCNIDFGLSLLTEIWHERILKAASVASLQRIVSVLHLVDHYPPLVHLATSRRLRRTYIPVGILLCEHRYVHCVWMAAQLIYWSFTATYNSPKCNPGDPSVYWYSFVSNLFVSPSFSSPSANLLFQLVLITSALCMSHSLNSETRNLIYNLPVDAAETLGFSTTASIGPGGGNNSSTSIFSNSNARFIR